MSRPERLATIAARYLAHLARQENTMTDAYGHYDAADFGLQAVTDQPAPAKRECDALCRDVEQDRDRLAALVLHAAAECHRGKWAFEDGPAFDALHRIGEMLRPSALADRSPSPRRRQEAAVVRAAITWRRSGDTADGHRRAEAALIASIDALPPVPGSSRRAPEPKAGDRVVDGGVMGTLVRCHECGGGGLLHQPDELPETAAPKPEPADRLT